MKQTYRFLLVAFMLAAVLLNACGAAAATAPGASKVSADVIFTGTIESISGTQWVVNGRTITVDPAVIRDGQYKVGDTVKVEGIVQSDGSLVVTRVEAPDAIDPAATDLPDDNSNDANSNDANSNDTNTNDDNGNDDNSNDANANDDDSNGNGDDANVNDDNGNGDDSNDNGDDDANDNGDDNSNDSNTNG